MRFKPVAGPLHQFSKKCLRGSVEVRQKRQVGGIVDHRQSIRRDVSERQIVEDENSPEVQGVELPEGNQSILRVNHSGTAIHGRQQLAEIVNPIGRDGGQHHQVGLRRHELGNCSAKWIVLSFFQYTRPRYIPGLISRISSRMCSATREVFE